MPDIFLYPSQPAPDDVLLSVPYRRLLPGFGGGGPPVVATAAGEITRAQLDALAALANTVDSTLLPGQPYLFLPPVFIINSQAEMLRCGYADDGGTFPAGICIRMDLMQAYQLASADYKTLGSWSLLTTWQVRAVGDITPFPTIAPGLVVVYPEIRQFWFPNYVGNPLTLTWVEHNRAMQFEAELDRLRSNVLAHYTFRNYRIENVGADRYFTQRPLTGYTDQRFAYPTPITRGLPWFVSPQWVYNVDAGPASVVGTYKAQLGRDPSTDQARVARIVMRVGGAVGTWHLSGDLYMLMGTAYPDPDLTISDPFGMITGVIADHGYWFIHLEADVGPGDYPITVTNARADFPDTEDFYADVTLTKTFPGSSGVSISAIHGDSACKVIDIQEPPRLYYTYQFPPNSKFSGQAWVDGTGFELTLVGLPANGVFMVKPWAVAGINANPLWHVVPPDGSDDTSILAYHAAPEPYRVPRVYWRKKPLTVKLQQYRVGIPPIADPERLVPVGCTIVQVLIARRSTGTPNITLPGGSLSVAIGCMRSGIFVTFQTVTIAAGQRFATVLFPDWVDFTQDCLVYDASEVVDIHAYLSTPGPTPPILYDIHGTPFIVPISSPISSPFMSHLYNDTKALINGLVL